MPERFPVNRIANDESNNDQGGKETYEIRSDEITNSITDQMNEAQAIKDARDAEAARQAEPTQGEEDYYGTQEPDAYSEARRDADNQARTTQTSNEQIEPEQDEEDTHGTQEPDAHGDAIRDIPNDNEEENDQSETPAADTGTKKPLIYKVIDRSYDAKTNARDWAERRHSIEIERGHGIGKFLNKIWKGSLVKLYYINKYNNEALEVIRRTKNVNYFSDMSAEEQLEASQTIADRFDNGDENDTAIHFAAGEEKRVHSADGEYAIGIKDIIRKNFGGEYATRDDFEEAHKRFVQEYRRNHSNEGSTNEGIVEMDNLFDIANSVKNSVEHGESLDNVLQNMIIVSGETRDGVRTEAELDIVDKFVEKMSKTKIGLLVSPGTLAVASSIALSIANFGARSVASAATKMIIPGAVASIWAGVREKLLSDKDRATHSRQMARGETPQGDDKLRESMETTRYETVSAKDLIDSINSSCYEGMFSDCSEEQSQSRLLDVLGNIAAIETRIRLSDETSADFISYSSVLVGGERLELDRTLAEAKVSLNNQIESNGISLDDLYQKFGLSAYGPDQETDLGSNKLNEVVEILSGVFEDRIENDVTNKDATYRVLRAKRVAVAATKAFATGMFVGVFAQEVAAVFNDTQVGIFDNMLGQNNTAVNGDMHHTTLEAFLNKVGNHTVNNVEFDPSAVANMANTNGEVALSGGYKLVDGGNNVHSILSPSGNKIAEATFNTDGKLSDQTIDQLKNSGVSVVDKSVDVDTSSIETKNLTALEYLKNHVDGIKHISHSDYYNNDTDTSNFNELRLDNAGTTETSFQYDVSRMTADGSYHNELSANWVELANEGRLNAYISVSTGTQSQVFEFPIGPDGKVNIPFDSPAAKLFDADGTFKGGFFEAAQTNGLNSDGAIEVIPLATVEGLDNINAITDNVLTKGVDHKVIYDFIVSDKVDSAPIIPIVPRSTMRPTRNNVERRYGYSGNYNYMPQGEMESRRSETSPRLINDPEAILVPGEEYTFYKDLLKTNKGGEYVKEIEDIISKSPELNSIDSNIKTIVKIPVNAAGESESENIYNVLTKAYGSQKQEALENSLILLHVNWFDGYDKDEAAMRANIAKTRSEIQRAKNDFPHIKIATIESEWKRSEIKGGIIGYVSRKLDDVTLLALESATSSGRMDENQDVLLIRNDADPKGLATNYLERYNNDFANNPKVDIFTGTTSFDNTKASRLPGFVFAANFMQSLDIISASRGERVHTAGANFGVRASVLAAVGATGFDDYNGVGSDDVHIGKRIVPVRKGVISNNYKSTGGYYNSSQRDLNKRKVAMRVHGARVDTDSDRGEEVYAKGVPIIYQWNEGFDDGGYKPRNFNLKNQKITTESLANDFDSIVAHLSNDMEATINYSGVSESTLRTALEFTFPGMKGSGYNLQFTPGDGYRFEITPQGASYLRNHLTRSKSGRPDAYGDRKIRQLYKERLSTSSRQAIRPRLIKV